MRGNFPPIRPHPDARTNQPRSSEKDKDLAMSPMPSYIRNADTTPSMQTYPKKEPVFRMPMPKGTCPPSEIKTMPGSSSSDRPRLIGDDSQFLTFGSLMSTGIKVDKSPSFSAVTTNGYNASPKSENIFGVKTQNRSQTADVGNTFSNINLAALKSNQTTQQSSFQPVSPPSQKADAPRSNPFLKSNTNQTSNFSLNNLIDRRELPQQTSSQVQPSLAQRPANNIFALPTPQPKSSNSFQPFQTPPTYQTSTLNNTNNANANKNSWEQKANVEPYLQHTQKLFMQEPQQLPKNVQTYNQNIQPQSQNMQNNQQIPSFNSNIQPISQQSTNNGQTFNQFNQNTSQNSQNRQLVMQNALNALRSKMNNPQDTFQTQFNPTMQQQQSHNNMQTPNNYMMQVQSNPFPQYTQYNSQQASSNPFSPIQPNNQYSLPNMQINQQNQPQMPATTPQYYQPTATNSGMSYLSATIQQKQSQLSILESFLAANPMQVQPSPLETQLDPDQTIEQLCEELTTSLKEAHDFLLSDTPIKYIDQIEKSRLVSTKFKQLGDFMVTPSSTLDALQTLHFRQDMIERELDWLNTQFGPTSPRHPTSELLQNYHKMQQIVSEWRQNEEKGEEDILLQLYECLSQTESAILQMQPMMQVVEEYLRWDL